MDQVNTRLRRLWLEASSPTGNLAVAQTAGTLVDRLTRARQDCRFLDDVSDLTEPPTRLTMVLLKRSEYRAALEGFLEFRRSAFVRLDEPLLAAPLTNLPKLYEAWGTLEVIATFVSLAASLGYAVKTQNLVQRRAGQVWVEVLKDGRTAVEFVHPSGQTAKLIPQRSYPSGGTGLHSLSFAKRPDVAIEITDPSGQAAIWILDPKYKLDSETQAADNDEQPALPKGSPKTRDIDAMHAYRDAIRDSSGQRVVCCAAILYPGLTRFFGSDIAALEAQPLNPAALQRPLTQLLSNALEANAEAAVAA